MNGVQGAGGSNPLVPTSWTSSCGQSQLLFFGPPLRLGRISAAVSFTAAFFAKRLCPLFFAWIPPMEPYRMIPGRRDAAKTPAPIARCRQTIPLASR